MLIDYILEIAYYYCFKVIMYKVYCINMVIDDVKFDINLQ